MRLDEMTWLVWPGAGANRDHHTLVAIEDGVGCRVRRCNFDYQNEGRKAPDRAPRLLAAIDRELTETIGEGTDPATIVLGGRSMGGRMCSMAVADGSPASGLILLSYPLHPMGKPDRLRVDHFDKIDVPVLFIAGDRDPMCPRGLLDEWVEEIPGDVTVVWLEGQRHDPKGCDEAIVDITSAWLANLAAA